MDITELLLSRWRDRHPNHAEPIARLRAAAQGDAHELMRLAIADGLLEREAAGRLLGDSIGHSYVNVGRSVIRGDLVARITPATAMRLRALPLYQVGEQVTVAMAEPRDDRALAQLGRMLGCAVSPVFSLRDEIEQALSRHSAALQDVEQLVVSIDLAKLTRGLASEQALEALIQSSEMVKLGDSIIVMALKERASDIHIEPRPHELLVRFRIDGVLRDRLTLPASLARALTSRYKIIAKLDIADRRRPQDGRIKFRSADAAFDLRISSMPVLHGEKIVMRVLGSAASGIKPQLSAMGISDHVLEPLQQALASPVGLLLVTGPTGSGKTTTLHAALHHINTREVNITTIEDPVEVEVSSLNQVMVHDAIGVGFAEVLRAALRQDPDVILVGEVRDAETARIAAQSALTGHLVLTTLHTNDAIQAATRLLDMGVEPYVVAPALVGVLAQRLVRRLCPTCTVPHAIPREALQRHFHVPAEGDLPLFFRGEGCERCDGTGFRGRIGVHEFLRVTPRLREAILRRESTSALWRLACADGFESMRSDGVRKALQGLTTLDEVLHATPPPEWVDGPGARP
jgi:type IV pilus assembly protein PilB